MSGIGEIPEIAALDARGPLIRIPPEQDVPLTPRVKQIIDSAEFRRLSQISQLGLVSLVYPGALHTRFEHSLGVYRLALLYLKRLSYDVRFNQAIDEYDATILIVAALVHDLGHWPFCHPLEDIQLSGVPPHEMFANSFLLEGEIADALRDDWGVQPRDVVALLSEKPLEPKRRILASILSGPIDIDKMDYLVRDSLHAGVPYGRHFDRERLIGSLCLNEAGDGLAITDKGKTAAELMVFARYVMFSEVYWHHAVRGATAMLQRAFYLLHGELELDALFRLTEQPLLAVLRDKAGDSPARELIECLFGSRRQIYKRLVTYTLLRDAEFYPRIARRPYEWLSAFSEEIARLLSGQLCMRVAPHEVLVDAPPMSREVEFDIEVYYPKERRYRALDEVSPVVRTLAREQFDDHVKRVRIFVHPRLRPHVKSLDNLDDLVRRALASMNA